MDHRTPCSRRLTNRGHHAVVGPIELRLIAVFWM
jgi:hypothetical protein